MKHCILELSLEQTMEEGSRGIAPLCL